MEAARPRAGAWRRRSADRSAAVQRISTPLPARTVGRKPWQATVVPIASVVPPESAGTLCGTDQKANPLAGLGGGGALIPTDMLAGTCRDTAGWQSRHVFYNSWLATVSALRRTAWPRRKEKLSFRARRPAPRAGGRRRAGRGRDGEPAPGSRQGRSRGRRGERSCGSPARPDQVERWHRSIDAQGLHRCPSAHLCRPPKQGRQRGTSTPTPELPRVRQRTKQCATVPRFLRASGRGISSAPWFKPP